MVLRARLCRECFQKGYDDTAATRFLLTGKELQKCEFCGLMKPLVVKYYKWGEHESCGNGSVNKDAVKHLGVNPNYSCWGDRYPYNDRPVTD